MVVYTVFLALDLDVSVRPILDARIFGDSVEGDGHSVGNKLQEVLTTETGGYEESEQEIVQEYGGKWLNVNWLTEPANKNVGYVHLTVCWVCYKH